MPTNRKPLILVNGEFRQIYGSGADTLVNGDDAPFVLYKASLTNQEATALVAGEVVYIFGNGTVKRAKADNIITAQAQYITPVGGVAAGASGFFISFGLAVQTASGSGGVTLFLSPTTAGAMTSTCPTTAGQYIVKLGRVTTASTEMEFNPEPPILLS